MSGGQGTIVTRRLSVHHQCRVRLNHGQNVERSRVFSRHRGLKCWPRHTTGQAARTSCGNSHWNESISRPLANSRRARSINPGSVPTQPETPRHEPAPPAGGHGRPAARTWTSLEWGRSRSNAGFWSRGLGLFHQRHQLPVHPGGSQFSHASMVAQGTCSLLTGATIASASARSDGPHTTTTDSSVSDTIIRASSPNS